MLRRFGEQETAPISVASKHRRKFKNEGYLLYRLERWPFKRFHRNAIALLIRNRSVLRHNMRRRTGMCLRKPDQHNMNQRKNNREHSTKADSTHVVMDTRHERCGRAILSQE